MINQKTTVDWLRFRTKTEPHNVLRALQPMFGDLAECMRLKPLERGILGFQQAVEIKVADMTVGRMDYGGESQRDDSAGAIASSSDHEWRERREFLRHVQRQWLGHHECEHQ